jgi:predicted small secreted protein
MNKGRDWVTDMEDKRETKKMDFICLWVLVVAGAFLAALILTGCNTVKGFAKDVYSVSEGIQNEMSIASSSSNSQSNGWED